MKTRIIFLLLVAVIFILIAAQCSSSAPTSAPTSAPNPSTNSQPASTTLDGKALLQDRCTACHSLQRATSRGGNATQWKATVDNMIKQGALLNADEEKALVNYLAQAYP